MIKGKIFLLMFILFPILFWNAIFQLETGEDYFNLSNSYSTSSPSINSDSQLTYNSRDKFLSNLPDKGINPTLKSWEESGPNSMAINRNLDLSISQTTLDVVPLGSIPDLLSSESAQNSMQADVDNLTIVIQDGAEKTPYANFGSDNSYDVFERTTQSPKDGSYCYNFSTNTGSGNFDSRFKSNNSLHDSDNATFLMNMWNSSVNNPPINPYSTPMNLSFDYNLITAENIQIAPYHRLEIILNFRHPFWGSSKSGSISVALLKDIGTPPDYDDPALRVKTFSGINGEGFSYSRIEYNLSAVQAGSGWHHFEANITDILQRFLNDTVNITMHYSVLDFIEVWATTSLGDFNYTLLLDNLQLNYRPEPAAVPLDLFWNGTPAALNNGAVSLNTTGEISSVLLNSSVPELNPRLEGNVNYSLTRSRNESISAVIDFENTSHGFFEANLTLPTLITNNETYLVTGILPTDWDNLTIFTDNSNFSATIKEIVTKIDYHYPFGELYWTLTGREGVLNGSIPNYLTQMTSPVEIPSGQWFFVNGTLLTPSAAKVKANVTFGSTDLEFETIPALDGSFSLFIPPIDYGTHATFELRAFWADQYQAGFWKRSVTVNGTVNPPFPGPTDNISISELNVPSEVECGDSVNISGSLVSKVPFNGSITYEVADSSFSVGIQVAHVEDEVYNFSATISSPPWSVTYHDVRLVLEDTNGNIFESETFEIRSIDSKAPSVTVKYVEIIDGLNISVFALDGPSESGVANVSVLLASDNANWSVTANPLEKTGWYSAIVSEPSFKEANVTIKVKDFAGNLAIIQDTINFTPNRSKSGKGSDIDLSPAIIGSAFLVTVLSGNQMIRLVKGRKVEL